MRESGLDAKRDRPQRRRGEATGSPSAEQVVRLASKSLICNWGTGRQRAGLICAVTGTVLLWIPIGLMIVTAFIGTLSAGRLLMDYFMPAELFFLVLAGWILLLIGSLVTQRMRILVAALGGAAFVLLFASQLTAVLSGLASGAIPAEGFIWYLVLGMLILYDVLAIVLGVAGIRLSHAVKTAA